MIFVLIVKVQIIINMPKPVFITNYFTTVGCGVDRVSTCNLCGKDYNRPSGSTGSLRNHLSTKHPEEFEELLGLERAGAEAEVQRLASKQTQKSQELRHQSKFSYIFVFRVLFFE